MTDVTAAVRFPVERDHQYGTGARGRIDGHDDAQERHAIESRVREKRKGCGKQVKQDRIWEGVVSRCQRGEVEVSTQHGLETVRVRDSVTDRHRRMKQYQQFQVARCRRHGDDP